MALLPTTLIATPRGDGVGLMRTPDAVPTSVSEYSTDYANIPILIRSALASRGVPIAPTTVAVRQPRGQAGPDAQGGGTSWQDYVVQTKAQYINFLRNSATGHRDDCADKYTKFVGIFRHDSTLSGQITARTTGPTTGRLDLVCDFLGYAHWCFAMGFAYALRDFDDPVRASTGSRCFTYQEFCARHGKVLDNSKVDEYLSRVIDEIVFYNTNIRNTEKNLVMTQTEMRAGPGVTTTMGWRGYDTDSWVTERISAAEMVRLLCI